MKINSVARKVSLLMAAVAIVAMGLLAACGPAAAPATNAPSATTPSATTPAASAPAPAATPAAGQAKSGGTLKFWLAGTPGGFDPHRRAPYAPVITIPIFNNIVRLDPTKKEPTPDNIIPDLASKWVWSEDGKQVTFTLVKGVTWHDGKPFTADDVVYSIQKMMDPARSGIAGNFPTYEGIVKLDESTVRITLKSPSPSFLLQLAHGYCPIEPMHKADVDWRTTDFLVGTGPFKLGKVTSGVSYEMVKNPNYFRKDASGKQLPYLDGVIVNIIVDRNASASAVAAGRLDMSSPITGVANLEAYNTLKDLNKNLVFQTTTGSTGPGYFFNCATPGPFTDARVRQAFTLLIDGKEQVEATYGSTLFMDPTGGILPPNYSLPKAEIAKLLGRDLTMDQRVVKAKKLMADAGYEKGFKMTYLTRSLPESLRTAQLMADQFKKYLNVDMDIVTKDAAQFNQTRDARQFSMVGDQPVSMLGEPNDLMPLFLGGSPGNFTGYKNAEADKLWQEQSVTLDMTKRRQLTQQIERILLNDAVFAPQALFNNMTALQPYVKGYVANEGAYCSNIAWEVVWLDK